MEEPTVHELQHIMVSLPEPFKTNVITMWDMFGTEFKKMPASKRYHSNFPGGLLCHTVQTIRVAKMMYKRLKKMDKELGSGLDFTLDDAIYVLILHDFGKIYSMTKKPYKDHVLWLVDMVHEAGISLDQQHAYALMYHHGGYSTISDKNPIKLSVFVHLCDHWASRFVEVIV